MTIDTMNKPDVNAPCYKRSALFQEYIKGSGINRRFCKEHVTDVQLDTYPSNNTPDARLTYIGMSFESNIPITISIRSLPTLEFRVIISKGTISELGMTFPGRTQFADIDRHLKQYEIFTKYDATMIIDLKNNLLSFHDHIYSWPAKLKEFQSLSDDNYPWWGFAFPNLQSMLNFKMWCNQRSQYWNNVNYTDEDRLQTTREFFDNAWYYATINDEIMPEEDVDRGKEDPLW